MKDLLMGNEAIALGALASGVKVVSGYPGTPSTEVLETIAAKNPGWVHVEWSVNEKSGMEVAAGAAYTGARSLVTMKQMGLNVASDPLMCVNYIGVKAGMVVFVADDPGPISSQTEQDTRHFGKYAKIPVFDCSSPEEAMQMVQDAFDFSEKNAIPVILRATTRVCHSCASVELPKIEEPKKPEGFTKDKKWVIFPQLSYKNKKRIFAAEPNIAADFDKYAGNEIIGNGKTGIACGGISVSYVMDAIQGHEEEYTIFKVATPYPFPEKKAQEFLKRVDKVIVFEELDPVIEDALVVTCAKSGMKKDIKGKRDLTVPEAGELSAYIAAEVIKSEGESTSKISIQEYKSAPAVPARPPVLCAGCPHRGAFYAVKKAMKGKKAIFGGDIGCYTLGNAAPLDMVDTCLCMGAGFTLPQGMYHADPSAVYFGFVGDSTFFASGITGAINAVYNKANMVLVILDNSTTAMTGHQPHPGMGITVMREPAQIIDIAAVLKGIGIKSVQTVDPLDYEASVKAVQTATAQDGVKAIVFKSPCIAITKKTALCHVDTDSCIGCKLCMNELGCPALYVADGKAVIDKELCTGCGLCAQICPSNCIKKEAI